jgi:membrane protein
VNKAFDPAPEQRPEQPKGGDNRAQGESSESPQRRIYPMPSPQKDARLSWRQVILRPKTLGRLLKRTFDEWMLDKIPRMGAALAYYMVFSLAPLLVIAVAVAGLAFGERAARGAIVSEIQGLVGTDAARAIQTMLRSAYKPGSGITASVIGVVVLLFGASGVFAEMQDALNTIWEVRPNPKGGLWNWVKSRFLSFGMVLGIGFLLLVSLLLTAAVSAIAKFWSGYLPLPAVVLHSVDVILSFAVTTLLFAMIFKFLPDAEVAWTDVLMGAGLTAFLFTVGKFAIGFYVGKSISASAYGAAASLMVVIAWVYYAAQILYFGAEFTQAFANEYGSRVIPKPGATPAPKPREEARA